MTASLRMLVKLWRQYARMDLLWFLRDTRYCLLWIVTDTMTALASVSAVLLVTARFGGVGGMTGAQVLFLCGYAVLTDGVFWLFFAANNIGYISRVIGRGQIDHMLIQPIPLWVQVIAGGFQPVSGSSKLLCGIILTATAVPGLHVAVTPGWVALLAASVFASTAVILAVDYLVACCAFYAPVAAEEISGTVLELFSNTKYYPLGGLKAQGILVFCTVLPVGLAAWFPVGVLLGKAPLGLPTALTFLMAVVFTTLAALTFQRGIKHYERNGCVRYSGFGFR